MMSPRLLLSFLVLLFAAPLAHAQVEPDPGTGLTVSFSGAQMDVLVPITLSRSVTVAPSVSFAYVEDAATDLGLGAVLRLYLRREQVSPYLALRAAMLRLSPDDGEAQTDVLTGAGFGLEHFVSAKLSVGVEAQVNMTMSAAQSGRFGNPDRTNFNTAAVALLTVYL